MTQDEMVGWHHWLDRHEFEQTLGDGEGQWSVACCSPWDHKESDPTESLTWTGCFYKAIYVASYAIVFPLQQGFCRDISMLPEDKVCICSQLMPNIFRLLWVLKSTEYRDDFSSGSKNNTLKQSPRRPFSVYNNHGQLRYLVCKSTKYLIFIKKLWYIGCMGSTVLYSDLKEC